MRTSNPRLVVLLLALLVLLASRLTAQDQAAPRRSTPYDAALVDAIGRLPVQEDGRIKPFRAVTDWLLVRLNGRMSFTLPKEPEFGALAGNKMSSVEWALDMMLYPEQAADYPVIVVPDREVLDLIGLSEIANTKRGRHSWNELEPGYDKLLEIARRFHDQGETKDKSHIQELVESLNENLWEYSRLRWEFEGLRRRIPLQKSAVLDAAFPGHGDSVGLSAALAKFSALAVNYAQLDPSRDPNGNVDPATTAERSAVEQVLRAIDRNTASADSMIWFAPDDAKVVEWSPLSKVAADLGMHGPDSKPALMLSVARLQDFLDSAGNPAAVTTTGLEFAKAMKTLSDGRGDVANIDLEVSYLNADWFGKAQFLFLFAFLAVAVSWFKPRTSRWSFRITWALAIAAEVLLVTGIVQRCILIARPPVATLYETVLFITAMLVLVAFVIEWIGKRRIALPLATVLGAVGMFLAYKYEMHKEKDTIEEVQAVLRTNFWLGVHVTTVTIGYASTLLAGFIAHVFLLGKLFGLRRDQGGFYQSIARMTYGVICFATFFSTFGTISGGIWANDSWGRFWGWDPKENGALMIVLWNLLILHGRLGGLWRNWGMNMLAVVGNAVVAFSWWHVNVLGVGLHSYGFDAGLLAGTLTFYGIEALVLILGIVAWLRETTSVADRKTADVKQDASHGGPSAAVRPAES